MKKFYFLWICLLLMGCGISAPDASSDVQHETKDIPPQLQALCEWELRQLMFTGVLFSDWQDTPSVPDDIPAATDFAVTDIRWEGDVLVATAALYGNIGIDPDPLSLSETLEYGFVMIMPERPLAFGQSVVRFSELDGTLTPIACSYERYLHPGLDYLKAETERLQPTLSQSERIDIAKYDPLLVEYIWRLLFSRRYIERPEDITLYDLENLRDPLELPHASIYDADTPDTWSADYRMDASLLRLTPNVTAVHCPYRLADYSVFEGMQNLRELSFRSLDDEALRSLKVGHTDVLQLYDPELELLDLTNVNTSVLKLHSWSSAIGGFAGCERIEKLYIMSTRTDMRLVNADTFPNVSYLNLYFYSDSPRVRDFSRLATFQNATIDLYLDYRACNNKTLESLRNVKLHDMIVNPENGSYPLPDLDRALLEQLDSQSLTYGRVMYFEERDGEEQPGSGHLPMFSKGPDGKAFPLAIGDSIGGWTLVSTEEFAADDHRMTARFIGEARLYGTLRIHPADDAPMSGVVEFIVAEQSLPLLPYYVFDTRSVWFEITNPDEILAATGGRLGEHFACELTISEYDYILAPMMSWNTAFVNTLHVIG